MVLYKYHGFIADSEISTDQIEGEIFILAVSHVHSVCEGGSTFHYLKLKLGTLLVKK